MSTVVALLAVAASALSLVMLCLSDPKRRRAAGSSGRQMGTRTRRTLAISALVPGMLCAFNGDAAAFLMWLGGCVLMGWGTALCLRALTPHARENPR